jgi:Fic family protein
MSTIDVTHIRTYKETHPWLTFKINLGAAQPSFWMALGECQSKCEHLAGIPLAPELDKSLHEVYLAKGVAATTAIEGNTLSEEQVLQHIQGKLSVPPSQEYLTQEIDNVIEGCNLILNEIKEGVQPPLSLKRIMDLNRIILDKLVLDDPEIIPGQIRKNTVGVGTYRGAPAEDCEHLVAGLCEWLNGEVFHPRQGMELPYAIIRAAIAHLYIAWIHPFGDGNGRTARLIEVQILLSSGVPSPAAHLLSNHYNKTRTEYYRHLDKARKDVIPFLFYAISGLRDELRQEIEFLRVQQWEISWINHVHKTFDKLRGTPHSRRKHLVLDLSKQTEPVAFAELKEVSARVAVEYKDRSYRTLVRDVKELINMDLITSDKGNWRAKKETILAFLPIRASSNKKAEDVQKTPKTVL